ncbi:MAG: stage III sporulation protein AF [Lachnospiraceae bacterium]|nr:stage III sporulation protein AF [Lachnospiraceae bacterium]
MQEILDMVKYVAVFYLLEQMVFHLLPGKIYEKYVRFYLGLLLVVLLLHPILRILRMTEQFDAEALICELEQEVEELDER